MEFKDLSVVLQGPVVPLGSGERFDTADNIKRIREIFDGCEIVLATWENSDLRGIEVDRLLVLKDPGASLFIDGKGKLNNINRMIHSAKMGIAAATKPFVLKIRTDLMPTSADFIKIWDRLAVSPREFGIFKRQVMAYPIYSLLFEMADGRKMRKPFHVSDWAFFGLAEDIERLFDVPLVDEPVYSDYFNVNKSHAFDVHADVKCQYDPEQYLIYTALKRVHPGIPEFKDKHDYRQEVQHVSDVATFHNFLFIDVEMWGLQHNKKEYDRPIWKYDPVCFNGLIGFGKCMRYRRKMGLKFYYRDLVSSTIRDFLNERKFRKFWKDEWHDFFK